MLTNGILSIIIIRKLSNTSKLSVSYIDDCISKNNDGLNNSFLSAKLGPENKQPLYKKLPHKRFLDELELNTSLEPYHGHIIMTEVDQIKDTPKNCFEACSIYIEFGGKSNNRLKRLVDLAKDTETNEKTINDAKMKISALIKNHNEIRKKIKALEKVKADNNKNVFATFREKVLKTCRQLKRQSIKEQIIEEEEEKKIENESIIQKASLADIEFKKKQ